jgi:hypothetical protein
MQQPHVFFGRRPEQREAHTRRQQAGVGARGSARPLLHEGRDQEISGQGQSRSEQGAHTDARHGSVLPSHKRFSDQGGEDESRQVTNVPQGKKGPMGKGENVCQRMKTERRLDKTGHDTPHCVNKGSLHHHGSQCIGGLQSCLFHHTRCFFKH